MKNQRYSPVMRALILGVLFLLAPLVRAGTSVQFNLTDPQFGISMTTNIEIVLQAEGVNANGTTQLLPITLYGWTDTNGQYTFANLSASTLLPAYYHWTVPANSNPQGNGPPQTYQGDIILTSTNLGTISASTILAGNGPTYPYGSGWAWSAQASDLRYNQTTNVLTSYVQIGVLNSTSNSLAAMIPSTNGFITTNQLAGFASTNYANGVTNNFTSIVFSNPAAFATPTQVSNLVNTLATTNGISAATATNIANGAYSNNVAGYLVAAATNSAASTNYVNAQLLAATNQLANTNLVVTWITAATNQLASTNWVGSNFALQSAFLAGTNQIATNQTAALNNASNVLAASIAASTNGFNFAVGASNSLLYAKQPASAILTNLAATGAFTNAIAAGQNFSLTTNFSGTIVSLNATNQTFLTNGLGLLVGVNPGTFMLTNALPGLTNGFVQSNITNGLATIAYVNAQSGGGNVNTNQFAAGQNASFSTNFSGTIISINATNQTFLTNGLSLLVGQNPAMFATTNQTLALTNFVVATGNAATNQSYVVGANDTNYTQSVSNSIITGLLGAISATNSSNLTITTNNIAAALETSGMLTNYNAAAVTLGNSLTLTNGAARITGGTLGFTKWSIQNASGNVVFDNNAIASDGQGNLTVGSVSGIGGGLTSLNYNAITNPPSTAGLFLPTTNALAQGFFGFGTKTNFLVTTNVIGITGNYEGTYLKSAGLTWTNIWFPAFSIINSSGTYFIQSNSVVEAQSSDIQNWTFVLGSGSLPVGAWGIEQRDNGVVVKGYFSSTNIAAQIAAAVAGGVGGGTTNFILSGVITNSTTNTVFSTAGTNAIDNEITRLANATTNGASLLQVTNIVLSYGFANGAGVTNDIVGTSNILAGLITSSGISLAQATNVVVGMTNGLAALSWSTNYITAQILAGTNGLAAITFVISAANNVTNNMGQATGLAAFQPTNWIASLAWVTNHDLNFADTNLSNLSLAGSNVVASISTNYNALALFTNIASANGGSGGSATNSIGNNNGTGTNISLFGTTYLNSSNISVYLVGNSSGLIPNMTSSNTPSGYAYASSFLVGFEPYKAFKNTGSIWNQSGSYGASWLAYRFSSPTLVSSASFIITTSAGSNQFNFEGSSDGSSWNYISGISTNPAVGAPATNSFNAVSYQYYRWNFTNSSAYPTVAYAQLYGTTYNVISNTVPIVITSPVSIGTNSSNGNELEVNGNIDASSMTIGGQPIGNSVVTNTYVVNSIATNTIIVNNFYSNGVSQGGGTVFPNLYVTNMSGSASTGNGIYTVSGNPGIFTNGSGGLFKLFAPGAGNPGLDHLTCYYIGTNTHSLLATVQPGYTNSTLLGYYQVSTNAAVCPTNQPLVAIYNPSASASSSVGAGASGAITVATNGSIYTVDVGTIPVAALPAGVVTIPGTGLQATTNAGVQTLSLGGKVVVYDFFTFCPEVVDQNMSSNGLYECVGYEATNLFYNSITPVQYSIQGTPSNGVPLYGDPTPGAILQVPKPIFYNGQYLMSYQGLMGTNSSGSNWIAIAKSPDLLNWTYVGRFNVPTGTNYSQQFGPDLFTDATNGLHLDFETSTNISGYFVPWIADLDATLTNLNNMRSPVLGAIWLAANPVSFSIDYHNGLYWLIGSGGYVFAGTDLNNTNTWNWIVNPFTLATGGGVITNVNMGYVGDGPYPVFGYKGYNFSIFSDPYGGDWQTSPDGTNWTDHGRFNNNGSVGTGWLEGKILTITGNQAPQPLNLQQLFTRPIGLQSIPAASTNLFAQTNDSRALTFSNPANSFTGIFTGNGGGLTNLNAANITGTVTNAYYTNTTTLALTSNNQLAIGTNAFGGGGSIPNNLVTNNSNAAIVITNASNLGSAMLSSNGLDIWSGGHPQLAIHATNANEYIFPPPGNTLGRLYFGNAANPFYSLNFAGVQNFENCPTIIATTLGLSANDQLAEIGSGKPVLSSYYGIGLYGQAGGSVTAFDTSAYNVIVTNGSPSIPTLTIASQPAATADLIQGYAGGVKTFSVSSNGVVTGNASGLTNATLIVQAGITNVSAATSITFKWKTAWDSTNYFVNATVEDPSAFAFNFGVSAKTTTNCVLNFATYTGIIEVQGTHYTQGY